MPNLKGTMVCSYIPTLHCGLWVQDTINSSQPYGLTNQASEEFSDKAIVGGAYDPKPYLFAIYLK